MNSHNNQHVPPQGEWNSRQKRLLCFGILILTAFFFSPIILVPPTTRFGEATAFYAYPYEVIKHLILKLHQLPLWDPYSGSGDPLLGSPEAGQFYPPVWFTFCAPTVLAGLRWLIFIHLLAAAAGSYFLALWLGAHPIASVLAPLGVLFSPHICGNALINGIPAAVYSLAWATWGTAFLWRGLTEDNPFFLIAAGGSLAAQVLAGTTYEMHFTILLYALLILFACLKSSLQNKDRFWRVFRNTCLVFGCAAGLSAVKLLPVFEYASLSTRAGYTLQELEQMGQNPSWADLWASFFQFFGHPGSSAISWINSIYAVLAILALVPSRRFSTWRQPLFFWGILLIVYWVALGSQSPVDLFAILYRVLPGFRYSPYTGRILSLARLAVPLLAAFGASFLVDRILKRSPNHRWPLAIVAVTFTGIFLLTVCIPSRDRLAKYPYGQLKRTRTGMLVALAEVPRVELKDESKILHAHILLKNVGDEPWSKGLVFEWTLGGALLGTSVLDQSVLPVGLISLKFEHMTELNDFAAGKFLKLSIPKKKEKLLIAALTKQPSGSVEVSVPEVNCQNLLSTDGLAGNPPEDWNTLLGVLARWAPLDSFRVFSGEYYDVYPYSAFLHGFDMVTYGNPEFLPRYHLLLHYGKSEDQLQLNRLHKIFQILNVRFLLLESHYAFVGASHTRLLKSRPEAQLYEFIPALPRVWAPEKAVLLCGADTEGDFNSLESKLVVYHSDFDPKVWAVFSATPEYLDDLNLADLRPFQAVFLTRPRIRDPQKVRVLLEGYRKLGGEIILLPYSEYRYTHPYVISNSMLEDDFPAKSLGKDARERLSELFTQSGSASTQAATIQIQHTHPGYWNINLETAREFTPIVVSETFFPGWKAFVDGRPVRIYMADGIVRGIVVAGMGNHKVELRYDPWTLRLGAGITAVTILWLLGLWVWGPFRRKK